jgi:hypothetical protein
MAFTADNRPHTIGDLLVITGTVANLDTSADLSDFLSVILMGQVCVTGVAAGGPTSAVTINGTTLIFNDPGATGGRLLVIGKR